MAIASPAGLAPLLFYSRLRQRTRTPLSGILYLHYSSAYVHEVHLHHHSKAHHKIYIVMRQQVQG